jgi:hypothetical protein
MWFHNKTWVKLILLSLQECISTVSLDVLCLANSWGLLSTPEVLFGILWIATH